MSLTLSWDLFVIVFFAIIITYSFIIGKHESIKVIIATYIAIVSGQAAGNILESLAGNPQPWLTNLGLSINLTILGSTKLVIFVATIILLDIRGGFEVEYGKDGNGLADVLLTGLYGFATAGILLSTLLTFVAGAPLLDSNLANAASLSPIIQQSRLMQIMVYQQDLWFSFPAVLLIVVGIVSREEA